MLILHKIIEIELKIETNESGRDEEGWEDVYVENGTVGRGKMMREYEWNVLKFFIVKTPLPLIVKKEGRRWREVLLTLQSVRQVYDLLLQKHYFSGPIRHFPAP